MKILSLDKQKGFTLIEVIATIVIAGVVGAMTFSFFGQSFVKGPEPVSRLNKALGLQTVMENITRDYIENYAGSDTDLSSLKTKIGSSEGSTYTNKYGSYKLIDNHFIRFNSTGGTESTMNPGQNLLKVTIERVDPVEKERLTALFSTGGATGSSGTGGCQGGGGGGCMGVSVSISPTSASIATGATQQFTANVSGTTNTAVTWSVQEAGGGTVDSNGLYTAPSTAGTYHVTAKSSACSKKSATATVTVTGASGGVSVTINPTTASLTTSGTKQFTATVSGSTTTSVTWSATGGTVDSNGLYTAPTSTGTYYVTATSVADTSKSATATVTVTSGGCSCMDISSVSISPTSTSIATGATQQFTATVNGCSSNTGVTWSATGGTIDANGLYTAPATAGTYTVKTQSKDCSMKSATATVTVTGDGGGISVTISPTSLSNEKTGCTKQFSATVTGTTDTRVTWSKTGGGSIDTNGLYTVPSSTGTYYVTATSVADPTKSVTATISVCSMGGMCSCK